MKRVLFISSNLETVKEFSKIIYEIDACLGTVNALINYLL